MKREILISAANRETRVAILEDDQLVELLVDRPDVKRLVGDIFIGRVDAVLPGIQAAFVDIGTEKSAFLHASDLVYDEEVPEDDEDEDEEEDAPDEDEKNGADRARSDRRRSKRRADAPAIQDVLKKGQDIIVQVTKEAISTKGPRVTAQVSLAGRFLVYMPHAARVGVSRKIGERAERQRLRELVEGVLPDKSGGVIVRTVGEDVTRETFERELQTLIATWKRIKRKTTFVRAPSLLHRETSLTRGIVRDIFSTKVENVQVDSKQVYNEIAEYLKGVAPDLVERVKLYEGTHSLFDKAKIETEIRDLFKRRCDLPSGGYLIVEPTEALVSIDVNSGRFTGKKDPEKTILKINLEAAREVARQLRLRDIGGIIVVDFIDMETKANQEKVLQELRTHLHRDRARTRAFDVSDLGLIEMTRQRVRPSLYQTLTEPCVHCSGSGRVYTPETVVRRIERAIRRAGVENGKKPLVIRVHPEVAMYVLESEPHLLRKLGQTYRLELDIRDDPLMRQDEFRLLESPADTDVTAKYALG